MFVKLKDGNLLFDKFINVDADEGTLPVEGQKGLAIASTQDEDWDRDIIYHLPNDKGAGWQLDLFNAHGRILWMHDHMIPAIGKGTARIDESQKVPRLLVEYEWDLTDPLAQKIAGKFERGFLDQWSVGFMATVYEVAEDRDDGKSWWPPYDIFEATLLENSAVNIPANPHVGTVENAITASKGLLRNYAHMLADEYSDDSAIADAVAEQAYFREEVEERLKTLEKAVAHGQVDTDRAVDDMETHRARYDEALGGLAKALHRFNTAVRG